MIARFFGLFAVVVLGFAIISVEANAVVVPPTKSECCTLLGLDKIIEGLVALLTKILSSNLLGIESR